MAKIKLCGDIVDNDSGVIYEWWDFDYISARKVEKVIQELSEGEELDIDLNSPGGYCSCGAEIYTMLRQCSENGHRVTINVIGEACSAATVVMCGADEVRASDVAIFMFHNASTVAAGKERDMKSAAQCLAETDETIVNAYERKTGKSREELHALIDAETWMSVDTAMEYGFVDGLMFNQEEESEQPDENDDEKKEEEEEKELQDTRIIASNHSVIAQDKLMILRDIMLSHKVKSQNTVSGITAQGMCASNTSNKLKGGTKMTLSEAYETNPELQDEVEHLVDDAVAKATQKAVKEAVDAERKRIKAIDSIQSHIPADMVEDAKYINPVNAQDLALKVLQKDALNASEYLTNAQEDSNQSEANSVGAVPNAFGESGDDADELAAYVNKKKGR